MSFDQAAAERFLREPHVAVIAVPTQSGPPAAVPIWYDVTADGAVRILTSASTRRAKLLDKSPHATLVVHTVQPVRFVSVDLVLREKRKSTSDDVRAIAGRYTPPEKLEDWVAFVESTIPDEQLFTFAITRWRFADFSD